MRLAMIGSSVIFGVFCDLKALKRASGSIEIVLDWKMLLIQTNSVEDDI